MNIDQLKALTSSSRLEHVSLKNADDTPLRCRVNGKVKTWKRDANRVQVPVKHGMYNCFYITADNMAEWVQVS